MSRTGTIAVGKLLALASLLGFDLLAGSQAWANTAANSGILNSVSAAFGDAGDTTQVPAGAAATVIISLVPSSPTLGAPSSQTIAPGGTAAYNCTITTTSNGPEIFSLSAAASLLGATVTPSLSSVNLGASTFFSFPTGTSINGTLNALTVINVPADMSNGDPTVNGLAAGNTVVVDGVVFTVSSVNATNNGTANALDQIVLKGTGTANVTPAMGDLIAQQVAFTVAVTPVNEAGPSSPQTGNIILMAADPSHSVTSSATTKLAIVAAGGLTVTKYVRNTSAAMAGTGVPVSVAGINGGIYYAGGVSGNPGDTLEYLIQAIKSNTAGNAVSVIINDPLLSFVSFVAGTLKYDNCGGGGFQSLTDAADADAGTFAGNTVSFYPGTTAGRGAPATAGVIGATAATVTCNMIYRVRIN